MNITLIRRRVRIEGRVQGVGFRAATYQEALRLGGLKGYVRNLPDGSVEAVVVGASEQVALLIEWCRKGPPFARVDRLSVEELPESFEFQGFEIRRG